MNKLFSNFRGYLNNQTMYSIVQKSTLSISLIALFFVLIGILDFVFWPMFISFIVILLSTIISNTLIAKMFGIITNKESAIISALIAFLILEPIQKYSDLYIFLIIGLAISIFKYLFQFKNKHIFNPVAIVVFLIAIFKIYYATWWIGTPALLPFVIFFGLIIVYKTRRFALFIPFIITNIVISTFLAISYDVNLNEILRIVILSSPVFFFGSVMLTEPITLPNTKKRQIIYALITALFMTIPLHIGPIYNSPEFALIVANIFTFFFSPKGKLKIKLKEKKQLAPQIFEFIFNKEGKLNFLPGMYMEWTINTKESDNRGNRRYVTIASSAKEDLSFIIKIPEKASVWKRSIEIMPIGDTIYAGSLSGEFLLPNNINEKDSFVFIAGGIGITPFISMIKDIIENNRKININLFYISKDSTEFIYKELFDKAKAFGIETNYILSGSDKIPPNWQGLTGFLDEKIIKAKVNDFAKAKYYISGPNMMVHSYTNTLLHMGINKNNIKTDYFPGY